MRESAGAVVEIGKAAVVESPLAFPVTRDQAMKTCYASCFCEENIYQLAVRLLETSLITEAQLFAIFISNSSKQVPVWEQKSSDERHEPVVWDYHVILLSRSGQEKLIYDLDSYLPFPCHAMHYCERSFRPDLRILPQFQQ